MKRVPKMERALGIFETAETLTDAYAPFNVVGVLELETAVDSAGLRHALDRAQRRHPLLRVRIIERDGVFVYEAGDIPEIPLEIVQRSGPDHWQEVAEAELNRAFDLSTGPFMRCTLLGGGPDDRDSELVVSFLHTMIDGASAINLMREILETWDAAAAGRDLPEPEVLLLQPPVESFFPTAYRGARAKLQVARFMARQMLDEISYRWRARGTRTMPVHPDGRCRVLHRELAADDLQHLVRATRRRRVTLNSALNAAMLTAVQRRLYDGRAVPLRNLNFAIVRPYLQPRVADHHMGSYHVMLRETVAVAADPDFWQLATTINTQFLRSSRRGEKFVALLTVADVMRMILGQRKMRMSATALAYTGPTALPDRVGAIAVRAVHAMVSNLVLGPEYTAHARIWQSRLIWNHIYLDCDMDNDTAAAITDDIFELLHDAGKDAS
jgi:hypothetical protein